MRTSEAASSGVVCSLRRLAAASFAAFALTSLASVMRLVLVVSLAVSVTLAAGCKRKGDAAAEAAPDSPLVTDKSEGLLLTWIDDKGEFHTEQRVTDVPANGRDVVSVRVLDPAKDVAGSDRVFIADLRSAGPDGAYPVRLATRVEFDDVAVARRAKSGVAVLAPKAAGGGAAGGGAAGGGAPGSDPTNPGDVAGRPAVIIYGASWCGPCHQAAAYLKQKGIRFVEHDIEKDSSAAREMHAKLAKSGMRGGSIPVLDVRGRILVGFDARAVDQALGTAL
jgi:glutaredoxin